SACTSASVEFAGNASLIRSHCCIPMDAGVAPSIRAIEKLSRYTPTSTPVVGLHVASVNVEMLKQRVNRNMNTRNESGTPEAFEVRTIPFGMKPPPPAASGIVPSPQAREVKLKILGPERISP